MNCIPKEAFVPKDYLDRLICSFGLGVYNNPVALPCQHVFCRSCIEGWLRSHGDCPTCRQSFSADTLRPQWIIAKIIQNAAMICTNPGCTWTGPKANLEVHLIADCPETVCACKFGCGTKVKRAVLEEHHKACDHCRVNCPHCNAKIPKHAIATHESKCYKKAVTCPLGCGVQIPTGELSLHTGELCPRRLGKCRFAQTGGCSFEGTQEQLAEHCTANSKVHLGMLRSAIQKLLGRVDELESRAKQPVFLLRFQGKEGLAQKLDVLWSNGSKKAKGTIPGWSFFLSSQSFSKSFKIRLKVTAINASDPNSWKIVLGVFNSPQYCLGSWGKFKNSWGYISGNGNKTIGETSAYGEPYGLNDIITIEWHDGNLVFYKNAHSQGLAFNEVRGAIYLAVALADPGHELEILDGYQLI